MHFIGPDQLHGFEERPVPDVYPAGLDWIPDWRLGDDETLPWYHDLSSVLRAGPVRSTLQVRYDEEVVREARRAIAESARDPSRPLLLVVSFTHPHDPYEVPEAYWDRYDGGVVDAPEHAHPPDPADPPTRRLRAMVAADRIAVAPEQVLLARRGYYGAISLVDHHIGSILETLRESSLADDTISIFSSDHGDMLGERGLWYKMAPFEDSIRVPLLVHAPQRFTPRRVERPVSLLDVLPTLVELAGGDSHGDLTGPVDGVSLAGALEGDAAPIRDVPLEYLAEGVRRPQVTLVRGRLKLVLELGEEPLLYDVEADAAERTSRLGDPSLNDEERGLVEAAAARWDLEQLERCVLVSQHRRRLVARALAIGEPVLWDHPSTDPEGPYIRSGQDFWHRLESERLALIESDLRSHPTA
jgi:choline-sulfatase